MVEIFYNEDDFLKRLNEVDPDRALDPHIDSFPVYGRDSLCSLRLQVFSAQSDRFKEIFHNEDILDFERDWWSREAEKIKECMRIIDYNLSLQYVEKAKLKSTLNFYSDMIENHIKPPTLSPTPGRKALEAWQDLFHFFLLKTDQSNWDQVSLNKEDFSLILKREFEKEKEKIKSRALDSDQAQPLFKKLLIDRVSQYVSLYKSFFSPDKQDLDLLLIADSFIEFLKDGPQENGSGQATSNEIKTIYIRKEAQMALLQVFNGPLKTEENKALFILCIDGKKPFSKVIIETPISKIFLPFNLLLEHGYIDGMSRDELGTWISGHIRSKSKEILSESTMDKYLKNVTPNRAERKRFAAIMELITPKGPK